jgi:hypothetical protein
MTHKRPLLVWVIAIFIFLGAAWTMLSLFLISTGSIPLTPAQESFFKRLTLFDYAVSFVGTALNLIAAVALLMLRRIAVPLFLLSLTLTVVIAAWQAAATGWTEAIGGPGLMGSLIGFVLLVAVCLYAWRLARTGVLR